MKANELMIGDWVQYTQNYYTEKKGVWSEVHYGRVFSVGLLYVKVDSGSVAIEPEIVQPIPLTAEILEKNGFEPTPAPSERVWKDNSQEVWLDNEGKNYWANIKNGEFYFEGYIGHTHELQHAMRLCEIEKEIEL